MQNLVHRDIKSSNIFLDADTPPNAKIGDLGLAQNLFSALASESLSIQGDWQWLAPELKARTGQATAKSDCFSFGLVLIQLLSGSMKPKEVVPKLIQAQEDGSSIHILDSRMMAKGGFDGLLLERTIKLCLWMCSNEPEQRPDMSVILNDLQTIMMRIDALHAI